MCVCRRSHTVVSWTVSLRKKKKSIKPVWSQSPNLRARFVMITKQSVTWLWLFYQKNRNLVSANVTHQKSHSLGFTSLEGTVVYLKKKKKTTTFYKFMTLFEKNIATKLLCILRIKQCYFFILEPKNPQHVSVSICQINEWSLIISHFLREKKSQGNSQFW